MQTEDSDDMRTEYRLEDLGKGVRGKYLKQYSKGTNLVLLDDKVAKAFPTADAVNAALLGLLSQADRAPVSTPRPARGPAKRRTA